MSIMNMLLAADAPFLFAVASNQTNLNLRTAALSAGWNGASRVIATNTTANTPYASSSRSS